MKASELSRLAASVGAIAELDHMSLIESSAKRGDGQHPPILQYQVEVATSGRRDGEHLDFSVRYTVSSTPIASPDAEPEQGAPCAWQIRALWTLRYKVPLERDLTDKQISAFAVTTVAFTVHPYARQHVHWLTGAMGYTPLMLEVMRQPFVLSKDDDFEIELTPVDSSQGELS